MRRIAAFALLIAGSMAACGAPAAGPDPTFHVRLERGMCLGPCPVYQVEIDAAGLVTFNGQNSNVARNAPCQGHRQWRIAPSAVARLEALIDARGFFGFKDNYAGGVTDMPAFSVTVTRRGQTRRVRDYMGEMVGMPRAMIEIEDAIDIAAEDRACIVGQAGVAKGP
jgi:hypothetical protein